MITILFVIGIITIIGGFILGIVSSSFWGFLMAFAGGIALSLTYFALSMILENQKNIKIMLNHISEQVQKPDDCNTCSKCGKIHEKEMSSCPHCGFRQ